MKKKIVSCILCAAATISLVSGCGSNKETETDKKEAHAEKSVQSEDRNYEPVTIQLNLDTMIIGRRLNASIFFEIVKNGFLFPFTFVFLFSVFFILTTSAFL